MDSGFENDEDDIVILTDTEGNETEYEILGIVKVDDAEYALLTLREVDPDEEATEIVVFLYEQGEDGEETFSDVPDKDTVRRVQVAAEALLAENAADEDVN